MYFYNEDCMEIMKHLPDNIFDLVVTDPPYEIATRGAGIYKQDDKKYVQELDVMSNGFSEEVLDQLCRLMKKINIYIFLQSKADYSATYLLCCKSWMQLQYHYLA